MSQAAIQVIDVSKSFGNNVAVKELSLEIGQGEFFSLLGPSGCGKTTLLRMIAGFEKPTSGRIVIGGQDVSNVPPHKRPVNMVFQNYALFPHLSIFENVAFGLKVKGNVPKAEIAERVKASLELVRLGSFGERFPSQLSGGQQQRVALARAVVNQPTVLLLDEPLSALDAQIREEMQAELHRLKVQLGITFIMVTHDQSEALALSSRIAVFCQGNLEQVGTPKQIYEKPETVFVADFIGNTNLVSGKLLRRSANGADVEIADGTVLKVKDNDLDTSTQPGASVIVWVKPQHVSLSQAASAQTRGESTNSVKATIRNKSYQGSTTDYLLSLTGAADWRASLTTGSGENFEEGEQVEVNFESALSSFLAEESGKETAPAKKNGERVVVAI